MAARKDVSKLSVSELCDWLFEQLENDVGGDCIQAMQENQVNGRAFVDLTESDLKELCPLLGERKAIQRLVLKLQPQTVLVRLLANLRVISSQFIILKKSFQGN